MDKNKIIKKANKYAQIVRKEFNPVNLFMFGSHVNGTPNKNSDIDIAVIIDDFDKLENDKKWMEISKKLWRLTEEVDLSIEPILLDLKHDESGFAHDILKNGYELPFEISNNEITESELIQRLKDVNERKNFVHHELIE